jgi:hypothetical protein
VDAGQAAAALDVALERDPLLATQHAVAVGIQEHDGVVGAEVLLGEAGGVLGELGLEVLLRGELGDRGLAGVDRLGVAEGRGAGEDQHAEARILLGGARAQEAIVGLAVVVRDRRGRGQRKRPRGQQTGERQGEAPPHGRRTHFLLLDQAGAYERPTFRNPESERSHRRRNICRIAGRSQQDERANVTSRLFTSWNGWRQDRGGAFSRSPAP